MTVLTFPSTGSKSDKVPLVDDFDRVDQATPPPTPASPYHPKNIEAGEAGLLKDDSVPVVSTSKDSGSMNRVVAIRLARNIIILFVIAAVIMYSSNLLCKVLKPDKHHVEQIPAPQDSDSSKLYKSYTSYADAESEMLPQPPSSPTDKDYDQRLGLDPIMEVMSRKLSEITINRAKLDQKKHDTDGISVYNQNFEIDHKDNKISPPLVISESARFIHDFSVNITGIVDVKGKRCFVMPLMHNNLSPPISLFDLLIKMTSGYYSTELKKFLGNMRVVEPAVTDLSAYGLYISKECADFYTFKLEKIETIQM